MRQMLVINILIFCSKGYTLIVHNNKRSMVGVRVIRESAMAEDLGSARNLVVNFTVIYMQNKTVL